LAAEHILTNTAYTDMLQQRYQSYDTGQGKAFEKGELSVASLYKIGINQGDIPHSSAKQELYESILANSF
jgi:xylose isomerase